MQQGWALASLGNIERGIPLMRDGLEGWKNTGARVGFTFFPVTLAEMCLHAGRLDDSERLLDDALPMVQNNDEHFYEAELCRLKGELCLARHDAALVAQADAHFRRGIEVARGQRALAWELRCAMSRSRYLAMGGTSCPAEGRQQAQNSCPAEGRQLAQSRGPAEGRQQAQNSCPAEGRQQAQNSADALSELEAVYARFSEGFETADLRAARERIATLRAEAAPTS
jgi:hypothetical protein